MREDMYVVTLRCAAAAAVVSAVVLRRPTKEYTHPYSMMHRRLPTAGIEVTPHYHQLLVMGYGSSVCAERGETTPAVENGNETTKQNTCRAPEGWLQAQGQRETSFSPKNEQMLS